MTLKFRHLVIGSIVIMALGLVAVIGLYANWVKPEAPVEVFERSTPTERPRLVSVNGEDRGDTLLISGVVVDESGAPVPAVTLQITDGGDAIKRVQADADGRFQTVAPPPAMISVVEHDTVPVLETVFESRDDVRFVVASPCPVDILVLGEGEPLEGAKVTGHVDTPHGNSGMLKGKTDAEGRARLALPCGVAKMTADAKGFAELDRRNVDTVVESEVRFDLVPGVVLVGTVLDAQGEVIPDAWVRAADDSTRTRDDGSYSLRVDPAILTKARAGADGYADRSERMRVPEDTRGEVPLDFVLYPTREVAVFCAGLPDDSCVSAAPVFCTSPYVPIGEVCSEREDDAEVAHLVCTCGQGEVAVRGAGESVLVGPDGTEAWLDMRDMGSISARVTQDGEPVTDCMGTGIRIPEGTAELIAGMTTMTRFARCDEYGQFTVAALDPGTWMPQVTMNDGSSKQLSVVEIDGNHVDLGTIDLAAGGIIRGVVLDGLTDQGAPGVAVSAVQEQVGEEIPAYGNAISGSEGVFVIQGLPDGDYEVFVSTNFLNKQKVTVSDGEASAEVEIATGGSNTLDDAGVSLVTDDAGDLIVDRLSADSTAGANGLQEGDVVVGVTIMGFNPSSLPGWSDDFTDEVLETYGGPGMGVVVEREGEQEEIEVDLD